MRRSPGWTFIALALSYTIFAPVAFAQSRHSGGMGRAKTPRPEKSAKSPGREHPAVEKFQRMSPQEREQALAKLPSTRRLKLQKQLERYDKLTPAQREQLTRFNQLPSERQNAFRKAFQKYQKAPPERQQVMRDELSHLGSLNETDRAARIASPEFKNRYSKGEQQMLSDMAVALPPG